MYAASYRVAIRILGGIDAGARSAHGRRLISVFPRHKLILDLVIVYALHDLGSHKRCLGDYALQGYQMVQLVRAQRSWAAREFPKAANVCTVVYRLFRGLALGAFGESLDDTLEGAIECICEVEGSVQEAG